jgi:hypothetical protein
MQEEQLGILHVVVITFNAAKQYPPIKLNPDAQE